MIYQLIVLTILMMTGAFATSESVCSFNKGNCSVRHGFVQDYGYGGFSSAVVAGARITTNPLGTAIDVIANGGLPNPECVANPMTPITTGAAVLYNGNAEDANEAELRAIQCAGEKGRGYTFTGNFNDLIQTAGNLDPLQEELVFLTATEDIYYFNECQNGLFDGYLNNNVVKNELQNNAWKQFRDIVSSNEVIPRLREEYTRRQDIVRADSITGCMKEICPSPSAEDIERIRQRGNSQARVDELRPEINLLISRIPMANRDSMRAQMENLLMSRTPVTEAQFKEVYDQEMRRMNQGVQQSRDFIREITVVNGDKRLFCVDRNLKENLYRSGQIDHTIERLGLSDVLSNFKLRSQNRYGLAGTVITEAAMIPTYFIGYGAARLALRAGASSVRAISSGGRALASSTRLAMLGLEAADYSASIASALRDCDSDNFRARVDGQACDPTQEMGLAYEEASLAQCLTSVILPMATPLIGSSVRVVSSRRLDQLYQNSNIVDEIVVTAPPVRPERSVDLDPDEVIRRLSPYPELQRRISQLGTKGTISVAPRIPNADDIPFDLSNQFRPINAAKMRERSRELSPDMQRAIVSSYNALNNRVALRAYFKELYTDAALWMRHKGGPEDLAALERGQITEQAIAVVLVRRAKDRGETGFTTILGSRNSQGESLSTGTIPYDPDIQNNQNAAFRLAVRSGPFFDRNFAPNQAGGHGVLSHMIQREIVLPHVSRATNGNPQAFFDFLGTLKGINFWADLFDSGDNRSMTRPESITEFMVPQMMTAP